jgi:hypothetical protein
MLEIGDIIDYLIFPTLILILVTRSSLDFPVTPNLRYHPL